MKKFKVGDRVYVKSPRASVERKFGTVASVTNNSGSTRYLLEWEIDLTERKAEQPGYLPQELSADNSSWPKIRQPSVDE